MMGMYIIYLIAGTACIQNTVLVTCDNIFLKKGKEYENCNYYGFYQ